MAESANRLARGSDGCADSDLVLRPFTEELLPGWYDEWVERERVRRLSLHGLETMADQLCARGHHGEASAAAFGQAAGDRLCRLAGESARRRVKRVKNRNKKRPSDARGT